MIHRLHLLFARLRSAKSTAPAKSPYCLVKTEIDDELALHGGDFLFVESAPYGRSVVVAWRLDNYAFQPFPIAFCQSELQATRLKSDIERVIALGAARFDARTPEHMAERERQRRDQSTEGAAA